MNISDSQDRTAPHTIVRDVVDLCADCDTCRTLMDQDCLFFPELFRLADRERDEGIPITALELRRLVDTCTLCGQCPCPRIPADLMQAKSLYIDREGLSMVARLLTDVPRMARLCGTFPRLVDALQSNKVAGPLLHALARIHPERQFPAFPEQNFFQWAEQEGLTVRTAGSRAATYFVGCSAAYLFPQVGRATVAVLQHNGITVHVPPQHCCGMPRLVEGDRASALQNVESTMATLLSSARDGADLLCSCPTCGYVMRVLLKEGACYAEAYQSSVDAGDDELKVPDPDPGKKHWVLKKSVFKDILKDDGYFSSLDPLDRIGLAGHLSDAGAYLARLQVEGRLATDFIAIPERMVYFAPCHQRKQKIGTPYPDLLALIPGISIEVLAGMGCCGMGGNLGFKDEFHEQSLEVGRPVMEKIRAKAPQAIVTDCMSCKLQFSHALPYPVLHPMEILARAYQCGDARSGRAPGPGR